jgi:tyrosyl-tRNA synthetase
MLSREEIEKNMETYQKQVFKILDPDKTDLLYNSRWLESFSVTDILKLCSKYTVQQLLHRRDFGERIRQNRPLSVTELLYPLLVGYDSVHLRSDIEMGGTDQLFNFMASREIQRAYGQEPEVIITLPLLEGVDGVRKMSKSLGNAIGVNDGPNDMYGKIMSISDDLMLEYYELLSQTPLDELEKIKEYIKTGTVNPMEYKQRLAREIVSRYHGQEAAISAEEMFNRVHRMRKIPENLEEQIIKYSINEGGLSIITLLRQIGRARSNSESRRLIEQRGVKIDGEVIDDINYIVAPRDGQVIQVGKRYFRRLRYEKQS